MAPKRRTPMLVAGLTLVAVGSATATFIGPDDTLMVGEREAPRAATGLAVATHPVITDFVNLDLLVRVSAPGGVFVGSSHRVDTDSLLDRVEHYEISRMSLGSVGGRMVEGRRAGTYEALRPDTIVGWRDRAATDTGDEVELVVPLSGEPVDVVAVPRRSETRVTLALGAHVDRLFLSQIGLALVGALLVALRTALRARDRRKAQRRQPEGPGSGGPDAPAGEAQVAGAPPLTGTPASPPPLPRHPRREATLPRAITLPVLGALLIALALSGCAPPQQAPTRPADDPPTRPGMTAAEAREVVGEHDSVLTPDFTTYPVWASVTLAEPRRLQLRVRDAFDAPYRKIATVKVLDEVPTPVEEPRKPSAKVRKRADRVAMAVSTWWATGRSEGVRLSGGTKRTRAKLLESGVSPGAVWVLDGGRRHQYLVQVEGGHLMTVRHRVFTPQARRLTSVVLLPDGKRAKVIGSKLVDLD